MKSTINKILSLSPDNKRIDVAGWVRTKRELKGFSFIEINDGSTIKGLQLVVSSDMIKDYEKKISLLTTGASIVASGILKKSEGKNQTSEVHIDDIYHIGGADHDIYPLQKKRHSYEFLREIQHLRSRTNTFSAVNRIRNRLSYGIHIFFNDREFKYIHTPLITTSDCEGAGEMFQVTTLLSKENFTDKQGQIDYSRDFFGEKSYLTVSGQLQVEAFACSLGRVYTFGPTFRAEHSQTARHLAEFWMIEPEMAFVDLEGNMDVAEEFIKYLVSDILENCYDDILFFDKWVSQELLKRLESMVSEDFVRISYTDAINKLKGLYKDFEYPVEWGINLQSEHEKALTDIVFNSPVIVYDYPESIKPFYMKKNKDGKTVRAMDVLLPGLGEIIGGSQREDDYDILLEAMKKHKLDIPEYEWYLDLRRFGTVEHSGFGLGLERLLLYVTGLQNIRDVIPFPRFYNGK